MEASVATPPEAPEVSHDGEAEATRSTPELFQWSAFVHVGAGAEECEYATDGQCKDPEHFHSWVCLPNPYQARDIMDKAAAARARKLRALKDPESDSYEIMEAQLEDLRVNHYDDLVGALAKLHVEKSLTEIVSGLIEDERFEHHAQDQEELRRLNDVPEDERDAEEYERLQADVLAYGVALQEEVDKEEARELERLKQMDQDEMVDIERKNRMERTGTEFYFHTYYMWMTYIGARKPTAKGFSMARIFENINELRSAPPEVVRALREKIEQLEQRTVGRGEAAGN